MLVIAVLALAVGAIPSRSETPSARSRPGRVVLAAESPRAHAESAGRVVLVVAAAEDVAGALDVATSARSDGEDRAFAARIDGASAIELRAGSWLAWYHAANEGRKEREWTRALRRAHAAGKEVRAYGAAASWVARWSPVPRAVLDKPAQDPFDTSLDLPIEGLGLFDGPLVGVLIPNAPTADRVVERALRYGYRDVLLLAGAAEVAWDPAAGTATVRGAEDGSWIAWLDLGAGTRSRGRVRDARAAFPRDGDVYVERTRGLRDDARAPAPSAEAWEREPDLARLRAELERADEPAGEGAIRVRDVRFARDERTTRSRAGGSSGVLVDFEVVVP